MGPVVAQTPSIGLAFDVLRSHNINTNPGCDRARDPDMALGDCPGPDNTITSVAASFFDTNMATGYGLDSRHSCGLWCHLWPQTSQTPTVVGPQTQTGLQQQSRLGCHRGSRWQCRPLRSTWPWLWHDPQIPIWPYVWPRPRIISWPLVGLGATYINPDPTCSRAVGPCCNLGLDVTFALGNCTGHPD